MQKATVCFNVSGIMPKQSHGSRGPDVKDAGSNHAWIEHPFKPHCLYAGSMGIQTEHSKLFGFKRVVF